ncbi:hypothetical protein PF005_g30575 [Phytophthora fragariae]|uniref:Uncharacterized protein n=1 Tax=Phytophthora fragariae TaxID=53985 RepID=A0A6A3D8D0_9STRA|nr:hypothetical protein PF009_g32433 [Phytophthora fragariae]KAE8954747.1 hypothetical protein PF011_g32004 [Phytophthora fragariae]KAE9057984.1 hypothetical protein PF006_g32278 [Phytophthora fragariae]KAE9158642.1 hypothetical protein PF004_g31809 [Phytophthora fragariae]KAE9163118.1 hypothetical protein PF005_g30575 [Phytophthora fragariae]
MSAVSGVGTTVITPVNAQHLCRRPRAGVTIPGIATGNKKTRATSRCGAPCW